ncbi:MAG: hypothetical protein ABR559_06295 [Gemmatimonadota bacterium]
MTVFELGCCIVRSWVPSDARSLARWADNIGFDVFDDVDRCTAEIG